jgi:hypothetical protein
MAELLRGESESTVNGAQEVAFHAPIADGSNPLGPGSHNGVLSTPNGALMDPRKRKRVSISKAP